MAKTSPWGREPVGFLAVLPLEIFRVAMVKHLHLDAAQEGYPGRVDGAAPDEESGIAAAPQMPPLELEDEVLVLANGAQPADWIPGAVDHPVPHAPRFGRAVDVGPSGEVAAVEHRHETVGVWFGGLGGAREGGGRD